MHDYTSLIFLLLPLGLLYLVFTRTRRAQRAQAEVLATLRPGLRVVTTSGLHATVTSLEEDVVVLEIAPGVQTRWVRQAVGQVLDSAVDGPVTTGSESLTGTVGTEPDRVDIDRVDTDRDDRTLT